MPEFCCQFPGCSYVGSNRRNLSIHQNKAKHSVVFDPQENVLPNPQDNNIRVTVHAHRAAAEPLLEAPCNDQQSHRGQQADNGLGTEGGQDQHESEAARQRDHGRLVVLDPSIHRHLLTVERGGPAFSDSEDDSCLDDESDEDADRETIVSHVKGILTQPEEKLLPVLVKLHQPDQDIVLQTVAEISSEPQQLRWKNGLEFREYLDGQDCQVSKPCVCIFIL